MSILKSCLPAILVCLVSSFCVSETTQAEASRYFDPTSDVTRTVLANGMTVLVKERHDRPIVVTVMAYRVGSRNEQLGLTGLSHYLEHMQFKGTDKFRKGDIDLITLKNGGVNNAFTAADYTAFWFKFASDRWESALEVEASRMRGSTFLPEEFAPEKQVVIEELQGNLDGPWDALVQEVWAAAFTQHPYHAPVIGWLQDVKRATRDDMKAYYDRWYHPRNATLIVVGDVNAQTVFAKAEALFGSIPSGPEPETQRVVEPLQRGERRVIVKKSSPLERLMIGYRTPQIGHADSYALNVVATLLGTGKTSRLYRRLMEQDQSVTEFGANYDERYDPALFSVWAELKEGAKLSEVERAIEDEISRLATGEVTVEELARAKQLLEASFIMSNEDVMSQATLLGAAEMLAAQPALPEAERGYRYLASYLEHVHAVTAADVQRVTKKYLHADNRTVGFLEKEEEGSKKEKETAQTAAVVSNGETKGASRASDIEKSSAAHRGAATTSSRNARLPVERIVLPNGLVVLLSENHTTPTVSLEAVVKAGSRYETDAEAGLAKLVGDLLEEGTERRTSQEIATAIESVGGELSSNGGYARSSVSARVLSKDFDLALDFVSELLQRANFPEDRVKMAVARRLDEIKSRLDTPSTLASDTFNELVYAGHPAHRPAIGYEATVSKLTRAQMVAFHRRFFRPENTVVAVVGDFDARTVRERIEKAFADWRADGKFAPPAVPTIVRQTKPLEKTVAVNKEQVNIFMGHLGVARSHPDYYALQVLDTILGNSPGFTSRIPRILRDAEGLAYSAFSDMTGSAGVDPGRFVAYIGCSVENEAKALAGLRREIARIVKDPVSAQELADAQAYLTGSFVLELESNTQIADFLLNAEIYGLGFDYPEKYSQLIRAVTAADIARVARERLSPETMTTVVVGPRKKGETQN